MQLLQMQIMKSMVDNMAAAAPARAAAPPPRDPEYEEYLRWRRHRRRFGWRRQL